MTSLAEVLPGDPARYAPAPLHHRTRAKPGGGTRRLGIPSLRDRAVQAAVLRWITPLAERRLSPHVHGYRPARSCTTAIADLLRQVGVRPHIEVLQVDLRDLFDSLPHGAVRSAARGASDDPTWCTLVDAWLSSWPTGPGRGVPQGAPLSPLLANLVLATALDAHLATARLAGWIRYADDLTLVSDRRGGAIETLRWIDGVARRAGLALSARKTVVASAGTLVAPCRVLGLDLEICRVRAGFQLIVTGGGGGGRAGS